MTDTRDISADERVDALYGTLRSRYGGVNSRANGYVYEGYFRREQAILLSLMNSEARVIVDIACGSGLMLQPLLNTDRDVFGLDFNAEACTAASNNGLPVVRGDAFDLPLPDRSIDEIITCQFFNQQRPDAVRRFVFEAARVLRPGGQVVMIWRNGEAWVHRIALALIGSINRLQGLPRFPYEDHSQEKIREYSRDAGLSVKSQAVSFPPCNWRSESLSSWRAQLFGASNIAILCKPGSE